MQVFIFTRYIEVRVVIRQNLLKLLLFAFSRFRLLIFFMQSVLFLCQRDYNLAYKYSVFTVLVVWYFLAVKVFLILHFGEIRV